MGLPAHPPPPRPFEPFSFPLPEMVDLGAGLPGLLVTDHRLPLVQLQVMMRAGLSVEPADAPGAAYACVSMIDEGAGPRSALQLAAAVQEIGASLSIWLGSDSCNLSLQVLTRHLDRGLDLLADVLLRPHFAAVEWRRVQKEVEGRGQQRRADPGESASLGLSRLVFGTHPYARPLLPLPDDVVKLRLPAVRGFWRSHFGRDRAVVIAAGDIGAADLERQLGRRLAGWRAGRPGSSSAAQRPEPAQPRSRRLGLVDRPGASQSALRVGHLCPPRRALDWARVKLLNTVLGGSFTSRLNANLRERHGLTYGVSSSFQLMRGPSLLTIGTSVATENTAAALREILRELSKLRESKVSRPELDKARQLVIESLPAQAEMLEDLTEEYAALALHELPHDAIARLPEQVQAVDAARLRALAEDLLRPEQATLVVVGDAARLRDKLEPLADEIILLDEDGRPASS